MAAAAIGESSTKNDKPVFVRVKRKASQSPLDAFWLEINEKPRKRPLLDFGKLSISDAPSTQEELKSKKVLVRHVETITSSEVPIEVLQSFMSNSADASEAKGNNEETRRTFKTENKQDQLLLKAKQKQEIISKNARFEQIWRSRKGKKDVMHDEAVHDMCRLYDVVRVDFEEKQNEVQENDTELEDHQMMSKYLPLLREFMPTAAVEIESDIYSYLSKQASSDYVYDYYAVKDEENITKEDMISPFPLVQVDDDDDFYDGPDDSEYESDDSNAEDNPLNDYPDEEESEDEDEITSKSSDDKSEVESKSADDGTEELQSVGDKSVEPEDMSQHDDWSDEADPFYEENMYDYDDHDDSVEYHWR